MILIYRKLTLDKPEIIGQAIFGVKKEGKKGGFWAEEIYIFNKNETKDIELKLGAF